MEAKPGGGGLFAPREKYDFQRINSGEGSLPTGAVLINRNYIAFGNYEFGVFAAASGMSKQWALNGAALVYGRSGARGGGAFFGMGKIKNEIAIKEGYDDYKKGNIPQ